jgi:hypothetical protein
MSIESWTRRSVIGCLVENKKSWTLPELYLLPQERQITRHVLRRWLERHGDWDRHQALWLSHAHRRRI